MLKAEPDHKFPRLCCLCVLAVMAGFANTLPAATPPNPDSSASSAEGELDEVVVEGTPLWRLRQAIIKSEDKFYALYNEINEQDDFDVNCQMEAPLGTRLRRRVCRVVYYEDARAQSAQATLGGEWAQDPVTVYLERLDAYRKHALGIINGDPRLLRLVRERERLGNELAREFAKRFRRTSNAVE